MVHIAVLMMLKNESKRLHISLNSIKDVVDSLVIYDTGSTDNTIEICKNFCEKHKIPFRLKEGIFVNFCESRNVSLDFADTFDDIDYLLLMDCNDELRGGEYLQNVATENLKKDASAFLVTQEWFSGAIDSYFNVRLIKTRKGWRYIGVVHEYIAIIDKDTKEDKSIEPVKITDKIRLYQDRTQDDDKSGKRFKRDKELLTTQYIKDPTEPRTVFYLAQTYSCLNDNENAYYYYKVRTTLVGFYEERFESCLKCGEFGEKINLDWYECFNWYMKAFDLIVTSYLL
jgi:glycosyltransferase involved in cell wall biosynthesis